MKEFVSMRDLLRLIESIFNFKKKRLVHFALDLYIILLCGQRFLADHRKIEEGVKTLVKDNFGLEEKEMMLTFPMVIGKTNVRKDVCLNKQLMMMLIKF